MKFLIVKTSSLGDILHTFPAVSYLRNKFPHAQIDWVVEEECAELILANPQVSNVLKVNTRKWRRGIDFSHIFQFRKQLQSQKYDAVFDLQGNIKSGLITFFAKSIDKVGFGKKTISERPNLWVTNTKFDPPSNMNIREDYLHIVKSYFSDNEPYNASPVTLRIGPEQLLKVKGIVSSLEGKKVMVCPGSAWINKQLTPDQLITFLKGIQPCTFVFCWGSLKEQALATQLASEFKGSMVMEKLPLPALQHMMGFMDLVVTMDSLPLHLAATTPVSTYSFFGPSSGNKYAPQGPQHQFFQGLCPYGRTFEKRCPVLRSCPTGACLRK